MKVVKVFLMEKDNKQNSLENLNVKFVDEFCSKFGGCTTYTANGYYVGKGGRVYQDKDLICEIFVDTKKIFGDSKAMYSYFRDVAKRYQRDAKQESVSVVIDGHAFIIE